MAVGQPEQEGRNMHMILAPVRDGAKPAQPAPAASEETMVTSEDGKGAESSSEAA